MNFWDQPILKVIVQIKEVLDKEYEEKLLEEVEEIKGALNERVDSYLEYVAFIEMVQDKPVTEKELIDFCKETLAGFKVPKKVVFCELPKTSTGKIQKFELRKKV